MTLIFDISVEVIFINVHCGVSNHQHIDCLLNRLFRLTSEKIKAPRHWPMWGDPPVIYRFPSKRASNAKNVPVWWRRHDMWLSNRRKLCIVRQIYWYCSLFFNGRRLILVDMLCQFQGTPNTVCHFHHLVNKYTASFKIRVLRINKV